jgi:hypothetical protein
LSPSGVLKLQESYPLGCVEIRGQFNDS